MDRAFILIMYIGLISDTHSFLDDAVFEYFKDCDEIWHAGDFGNINLADRLSSFKPLRGVYGNIDGADIRKVYPRVLLFDCEGLKVFITHIGGYPGRYSTDIRPKLQTEKPDLFICGHSHILKIMPDKELNLLHINPGAAGKEGFHKVRTIVRFKIHEKKIHDMEVIELGNRG